MPEIKCMPIDYNVEHSNQKNSISYPVSKMYNPLVKGFNRRSSSAYLLSIKNCYQSYRQTILISCAENILINSNNRADSVLVTQLLRYQIDRLVEIFIASRCKCQFPVYTRTLHWSTSCNYQSCILLSKLTQWTIASRGMTKIHLHVYSKPFWQSNLPIEKSTSVSQ